mmetsp:Transcript_105609/g.305585  ORF Transcript_105609/g.305585 Transcript_105609/m.305585 type:complete len:256 (-) Transcript_105609:113-880(-)
MQALLNASLAHGDACGGLTRDGRANRLLQVVEALPQRRVRRRGIFLGCAAAPGILLLAAPAWHAAVVAARCAQHIYLEPPETRRPRGTVLALGLHRVDAQGQETVGVVELRLHGPETVQVAVRLSRALPGVPVQAPLQEGEALEHRRLEILGVDRTLRPRAGRTAEQHLVEDCLPRLDRSELVPHNAEILNNRGRVVPHELDLRLVQLHLLPPQRLELALPLRLPAPHDRRLAALTAATAGERRRHDRAISLGAV